MIEQLFIGQPPLPPCEWRVPVDWTVSQSDFFSPHLFTIILIFVGQYLLKNIFGSYSNKNPHCIGNRLFLDHGKTHFTILNGHLNKISRCKINTDNEKI